MIFARYMFLLLVAMAAGCATTPKRVDAMSAENDPDPGIAVLSLRWRLPLADRTEETRPQEFASVALSDRFQRSQRLYLGTRAGELFALEGDTGKTLWRQKLGAISSRPLVHRGRIYVGTDDGTLYCVAEADGTVKWKYPTQGAILEQPVIVDELLLFSNEVDHVYAVDRATGAFRWQYSVETPEKFTLRGHGGVGVSKELVFAGFSDGSVAALGLQSGQVVWSKSLKGEAEEFVDVDSTPVFLGDAVFMTSSVGGLYRLDQATGNLEWRLPVSGAGPIATDGNRLYLAAANQGIHAVDVQGNLIWRQGTYRGGEPATPVIFEDFILYALADAGLFVADKQSGRVVQYFDPGTGVSATPTLDGDELFVLSNGGILYSFQMF